MEVLRRVWIQTVSLAKIRFPDCKLTSKYAAAFFITSARARSDTTCTHWKCFNGRKVATKRFQGWSFLVTEFKLFSHSMMAFDARVIRFLWCTPSLWSNRPSWYTVCAIIHQPFCFNVHQEYWALDIPCLRIQNTIAQEAALPAKSTFDSAICRLQYFRY